MALTSSQIAWTRYYMGYSTSDPGTPFFPFRELAYSNTGAFGAVSLDGSTEDPDGGRLNNLSSDEEMILTGYFLPTLDSRRTDIDTATSNLDTDQAAVWYRNKAEMRDRADIYRTMRLELCRFLGFPPGSGLRDYNRITRS